MKLYLYLLESGLRGVDVYRAAVVVARDEDTARCIHPSGHANASGKLVRDAEGYVVHTSFPWRDKSWPPVPTRVKVTRIGVADPRLREGLVLSDFRGVG